MKFRITLTSVLLVFAGLTAGAQNIVPRPVKMAVADSELCYDVPARIMVYYYEKAAAPLAGYLSEELVKIAGVREVNITSRRRFIDSRKVDGIYLSIDKLNGLPKDGYRLTVTENNIKISAPDYGGLFNGIATLLQLFPTSDGSQHSSLVKLKLPCVEIEDYPRFAHRGMHLDVARTFSTKEEVMRFIDNMSRHKLNKFHWHLTDDEGWRIEIKSHPELAAVGGFRGGDSPIMAIYGEWDKKYGGYYTQDDIREVVAYAAVRNVEVIPEIDLPGHSRAAGKVYPQILCNTSPDTTASGGYDRRDVWCAAKEENYEVIADILGEIAQLFPSKYMHIGGDEVDMKQWLACPDCRALMAEEELEDGKALQGYFMHRVIDIVEGYGKSPAAWNEAMNSGALPKQTTVYGWESAKVCLDATSQGYPTVVMPGKNFYFDMKYSRQEPGLTWAGIVTLEDVYDFDLAQFSDEQMKSVVGVEGAFWSELYLINGKGYLDYQCYPRICALSEVAWTSEELRSYNNFSKRMDTHYKRLEEWDINYRRTPLMQEPLNLIQPSVKVTSSMRTLSKNPLSVLEKYKYGSTARTTRTCRSGDYVQFVFDKAVDCESMEFATGYAYLPRCLFNEGYAEVLYEGSKSYERYGDLAAGRIMIKPRKPVKAVRIVSSGGPNGETSVIFQTPRIIAK